jgi:hypothetical protein
MESSRGRVLATHTQRWHLNEYIIPYETMDRRGCAYNCSIVFLLLVVGCAKSRSERDGLRHATRIFFLLLVVGCAKSRSERDGLRHASIFYLTRRIFFSVIGRRVCKVKKRTRWITTRDHILLSKFVEYYLIIPNKLQAQNKLNK